MYDYSYYGLKGFTYQRLFLLIIINGANEDQQIYLLQKMLMHILHLLIMEQDDQHTRKILTEFSVSRLWF